MTTVTPETVSFESSLPLRRCGGQPGNINALKHGFYMDGAHRRTSTPLDHGQLSDINQLIAKLKHYMRVTYEIGLNCNNLAEACYTLRSLSFAAMGITRLIHIHELVRITPLLNELKPKEFCAILQHIENCTEFSVPVSSPPASS